MNTAGVAAVVFYVVWILVGLVWLIEHLNIGN